MIRDHDVTLADRPAGPAGGGAGRPARRLARRPRRPESRPARRARRGRRLEGPAASVSRSTSGTATTTSSWSPTRSPGCPGPALTPSPATAAGCRAARRTTECRQPSAGRAAVGGTWLHQGDGRHRRPRGAGGVGLCLSGGGYRAALFHLGALRRLDELGVLGQVRTVSAVSGGAIIANLLADPRLVWPEPPLPERTTGASAPGPTGRRRRASLPGTRGAWRTAGCRGSRSWWPRRWKRLAQRNIRTPALLTRLLPWRWRMPDGSTRDLADQLADAVPWWSTPLRDNASADRPSSPVRPRSPTASTGPSPAPAWSTRADGSATTGWATPRHRRSCGSPTPSPRPAPSRPTLSRWRSTATCSGSSVVRTATRTEQARDEIRGRIRLTDGGVYDNLALEPVWKTHSTVLVSDGGSVFRARTERTVFGRLLRIMAISSGGGTRCACGGCTPASPAPALSGVTWSLETKVPRMAYPSRDGGAGQRDPHRPRRVLAGRATRARAARLPGRRRSHPPAPARS